MEYEGVGVARIEDLLQQTKTLLEVSGAWIPDGDFALASGEHSSYYLDSKMLSLGGEGQSFVGRLMYELIRPYKLDALGGMEVSAIPLVAAIARVSYDVGAPLRGFYVKKEAKGHGTRKKVEGFLPVSPGQVAVIDDVVTTGGSVEEAVKAVEDAGHKVVVIAALVERHQHGGDKFREKGYEFVSAYRTDAQGNLYSSFPSHAKMLMPSR